jgi:hypothetical protein
VLSSGLRRLVGRVGYACAMACLSLSPLIQHELVEALRELAYRGGLAPAAPGPPPPPAGPPPWHPEGRAGPPSDAEVALWADVECHE